LGRKPVVIHHTDKTRPLEYQDVLIHLEDGTAPIRTRSSSDYDLVGNWAEPVDVQGKVIVVRDRSGSTHILSDDPIDGLTILACFDLHWNSASPSELNAIPRSTS
jgi:hypothetical protein